MQEEDEGGAVNNVDIQWAAKSSFVSTFSGRGVDFLVVECHPKISSYHTTVINIMYIASSSSVHDIGLFKDVLIYFLVPLFSDVLYFVVGDFNHVPAYPFARFRLR